MEHAATNPHPQPPPRGHPALCAGRGERGDEPDRDTVTHHPHSVSPDKRAPRPTYRPGRSLGRKLPACRCSEGRRCRARFPLTRNSLFLSCRGEGGGILSSPLDIRLSDQITFFRETLLRGNCGVPGSLRAPPVAQRPERVPAGAGREGCCRSLGSRRGAGGIRTDESGKRWGRPAGGGRSTERDGVDACGD